MSGRDKKISIIIPAKDRSENTKAILDRLIFQKQKFPQTEIIVVENGSSEDMSFLDNYDIICIHEKPLGVAHARNVALDICSGDYVCFVDNDDMVEDCYLQEIYSHLDDEYDWLTWQWKIDNHSVLMNSFDINHPLKSNWALWGYCFKKDLFNGIRFDETKQAGSDLAIFNVITDKTKGYFIKKILYRFTWEGNYDSISHKYHRGEF